MLKNYRLTNEDTFFITFLAAWSSIRQPLWQSDPLNMIIIINCFFFYSVIIAQIKYLLTPKKEKSIIGITTILYFLLFIFATCYIAWHEKKYLENYDICIIFTIGIMWTIFSVFETLSDKWVFNFNISKINDFEKKEELK